MTYTVRFSPAARDQLAEIEDYISKVDSPIVAARYVDAIVAYCERLATFPKRGHRRDDILPGLRVTHYRKRTAIAFDVKDEQISIVGVFYGGRDYEATLRDGAEDDTQR